eukprot:gene32461-31073_t
MYNLLCFPEIKRATCCSNDGPLASRSTTPSNAFTSGSISLKFAFRAAWLLIKFLTADPARQEGLDIGCHNTQEGPELAGIHRGVQERWQRNINDRLYYATIVTEQLRIFLNFFRSMPSKKKKRSLNLHGPDLTFKICGEVEADLPEYVENHDSCPGSYEVVRASIAELMAWFSSEAAPSAHLAFSSSLKKEERAFVHDVVASSLSSVLETASSGVGDNRAISVYLKGQSPMDSLPAASNDILQEAIRLWKAAREIGLVQYSRDEIAEQLRNDDLCEPLRELSNERKKFEDGVKLLLEAATVGNVSEIRMICSAHPGLASACYPDADSGDLPLHAAARAGMVDALRALVDAGAVVDAKDERGRTAFQVSQSFDQCDVEAVLLQLGAKDPDASSFPLTSAAVDMAPRS